MAFRGIQASKVSPSYLHSNSTSHTWPFSAIAELIDNAYDPDVNASELWIDKRLVNQQVCLTFVDNGNGMTPDKLHKMLSFGYCEKEAVGSHKPIGHYGNGFKSGSMRLGKDAIVFTRQASSMSVGMLSQSYLSSINAETVLVPIVHWNLPSKARSTEGNMPNNLKAIITHSIFKSEKDLLYELETMEKLRTGTKIMIYNLTKVRDGNLELDFVSDPTDIRNPESHMMDFSTLNRPVREYTPEHCRSLREYCSILYLKPRMKIVLRGKKVKTKFIQKSLSQTETDIYKPTWNRNPIPIRFGFTSSKNSEDYGIMFYHNNRLIKAYEKVGYQRQPNDLGVGVVGVVEAYFLTPTHNKQDFSRDDKYNSFYTSVSNKLNDYWNEKMGGAQSTSKKVQSPTKQQQTPDWTWAQCDNCLKWRRLPTGYSQDALPDKWYCHMNPDATFNRCDIEEEPEDDDEALQMPTYKKTFKKREQDQKRQLKIEAENQKFMREKALQAKEKQLKLKEQEIMKRAQSAEVSSSQEVTATEFARTKRKLERFKEQANKQEKLIKDLQREKQRMERSNKEMLRAVSKLNVANLVSNDLMKTVSDNSASTVTSTSSSSKTKTEDESETICVKTEDGDVVAVMDINGNQNDDKDDDNDDDVVDLTMTDSEDDEISQPSKSKMPRISLSASKKKSSPSGSKVPKVEKDTSTEQDVKPDINTLNDQIMASKRYVDQGVQVTLQSGRDTQRQLNTCRSRLASLQQSVHKLLKMIVPDEDLGDPDGIEYIVTEMIKHNEPS